MTYLVKIVLDLLLIIKWKRPKRVSIVEGISCDKKIVHFNFLFSDFTFGRKGLC